MQYTTVTDPDTGLKVREGARDNKFGTDVELTETGFAGTEDDDWMNIDNIEFPWEGRVPSAMTIASKTSSSISITWTNNGSGYDGIKVYVSTDNVSYTLWTSLAIVSAYTVIGLSSGTLFYIKLASYKFGSISPYCDPISTTTN